MNKGFTLIELLAVIIILSIVLIITTISVGSILSDSKSNLSETQKHNIEEASKTYYLKEGMSKDESDGKTESCVNLSYLISEGYIESDEVKDPKTGENFSGSVKINYEANHYSYVYQESKCE